MTDLHLPTHTVTITYEQLLDMIEDIAYDEDEREGVEVRQIWVGEESYLDWDLVYIEESDDD